MFPLTAACRWPPGSANRPASERFAYESVVFFSTPHYAPTRTESPQLATPGYYPGAEELQPGIHAPDDGTLIQPGTAPAGPPATRIDDPDAFATWLGIDFAVSLAGWPRVVALPRLPQIRTCAIRASGSSDHGIAALARTREPPFRTTLR